MSKPLTERRACAHAGDQTHASFLSEVGVTAGSAAVAVELRKHSANGAKYSELVVSYGVWGKEAVYTSFITSITSCASCHKEPFIHPSPRKPSTTIESQ